MLTEYVSRSSKCGHTGDKTDPSYQLIRCATNSSHLDVKQEKKLLFEMNP